MPSSFILAGGYAPADKPGIHAFAFDETTGALTALGAFAGVRNPSFLMAHPNGRWLYSVSETAQGSDGAPGGVCALSFQRAPFTMQLLNQQPSGGDWPCHLTLDATGRWLFVANYGTGSARAFPIQADGALGELTAHVQHSGSGPNAQRQEGPHAHSTTLTPDNRYAIVADLGIDQLVMYAFDSTSGSLTRHGAMSTHPGAGPRHATFHPNGRTLYMANELDGTVSVCDYDAAAGALRVTQTLPTLPPDAPENTVADIHFAAASNRLYVSNRGHNSLAVYAADPDGKLTLLTIASCGGNWPRNFALAPAGGFVLVANQYDNEIAVLPLHPGGDEVGPAVARAAVAGASSIQFV